jgi:hypothetical protein
MKNILMLDDFRRSENIEIFDEQSIQRIEESEVISNILKFVYFENIYRF